LFLSYTIVSCLLDFPSGEIRSARTAGTNPNHTGAPPKFRASAANGPVQNKRLFLVHLVVDVTTGMVVGFVHLVAHAMALFLHAVLHLVETFIGTVFPFLSIFLHAVLGMLHFFAGDMPCMTRLVGQFVGRLLDLVMKAVLHLVFHNNVFLSDTISARAHGGGPYRKVRPSS